MRGGARFGLFKLGGYELCELGRKEQLSMNERRVAVAPWTARIVSSSRFSSVLKTKQK